MRLIFKLNAVLFVLGTSLAFLLSTLEYSFWKLDFSIFASLLTWAILLAVAFRFTQLNLKLFPAGNELLFWKHFGQTFPRLQKLFLVGLFLGQISLWWWVYGLIRIPFMFCEAAAYVAMVSNQVELAERLYDFGREKAGTSISVISTYALANRGNRRADDPRIDEAIKKVYGERSPEMHERKRLLADFLLMTMGDIPRVEELRAEARAIDPQIYCWKRPFHFRMNSRFTEAFFFDLPKYRQRIATHDPLAEWTSLKAGEPGLVGAPIDPRYGMVMMDLPNVSCFPYPLEADGSVSATLHKYDFEFLHNHRKCSTSMELTISALFWFLPASIAMEFLILIARKRMFNHLARRWKSEFSSPTISLNSRLQAGNSLIALERLRKNIDKAEEISVKMIALSEQNGD